MLTYTIGRDVEKEVERTKNEIYIWLCWVIWNVATLGQYCRIVKLPPQMLLTLKALALHSSHYNCAIWQIC